MAPMTECLILSETASKFASAVAEYKDPPLTVATARSQQDVRSVYSGQRVVLGDPDLVAAALPDMPEVDWVQSTWAGVRPLLRLPRRDYTLTGIKDVFGPQMSEYVFGYLLAHTLKTQRRRRAQRDKRWDATPSARLEGMCLGIMGIGSIGQYVAGVAKTFGMRVIGLNRNGSPTANFKDVYALDRLIEFLSQCDYLVSILPDTEMTTRLLDRHSLSRLPPHALFVNIGRGNVVDESALVEALQGGTLAGAVLDVFNEEPLPQDSPLWEAPNLVLTAHIAAASDPELIVPIFVDNLRRYINGERLKYIVDFNAGY